MSIFVSVNCLSGSSQGADENESLDLPTGMGKGVPNFRKLFRVIQHDYEHFLNVITFDS